MRIFFAACSSQDTRLCYFALRLSYGATEKCEKTINFLFLLALYHNLPNCQAYVHCRLLMRTQHKVPVTRHEHWMRGGGAVAGEVVVVTSCARPRVRRVSSSCGTQHYKQINPPSQHEHAVQEAEPVVTRSLIVLFMVMAKLLLFHRKAVSPLSHTWTQPEEFLSSYQPIEAWRKVKVWRSHHHPLCRVGGGG